VIDDLALGGVQNVHTSWAHDLAPSAMPNRTTHPRPSPGRQAGVRGEGPAPNAANLDAMMKTELSSWPVTLVILVLAFRLAVICQSRPSRRCSLLNAASAASMLGAAGLPLMLNTVGRVAAASSLYLGTRLGDISIWAMNFQGVKSLFPAVSSGAQVATGFGCSKGTLDMAYPA
jgi:hypothetical protein